MLFGTPFLSMVYSKCRFLRSAFKMWPFVLAFPKQYPISFSALSFKTFTAPEMPFDVFLRKLQVDLKQYHFSDLSISCIVKLVLFNFFVASDHLLSSAAFIIVFSSKKTFKYHNLVASLH